VFYDGPVPKVVDVEERRHALADAAARVIAHAGLGGATLRDVAAEAGLTTGALTHYFADKRELLIFTLQASLERRRAAHPRARTDDALNDLGVLLDGVLPISEDSRLHWMVTIAFASQAAGDAELAEVQRTAYRSFRRSVAQLVTRAVEQGRLPATTDALTEAESLIALADGIAVQALFDPDTWPADRQRQHLHRTLAALQGS
jgi:AcrR family transcriptional regulator